MRDHAHETFPSGERLPCTPAALRELRAQADHLEARLGPIRAAARASATDRDAATSVPDPELHLVISRLGMVRRALANVEVVERAGAVVIGCSVVIRHDDDGEERYVLVAPGEGDPRAGRVSADSPLGRALLHHRVGDVVEVATPIGPRTFTLLQVDDVSYSSHPTVLGGASDDEAIRTRAPIRG